MIRRKLMSIMLTCTFVCGALLANGIAAGQAMLTFTAPAKANPGTVAVPPNISVIPDTFAMVGSNGWSANLSATLTAQGFTMGNGWILGNNPGNNAANPVPLGNTAVFNVTQYSISVTPLQSGGTIKEPVNFSLNFGNTPQPMNATLHWLNLLNEDQQYGTTETGGTAFGFQLNGLPGFWELDNGDVAAKMKGDGVGPYYDSNMGPNTVPPNFSDNPSVGKAVPGTYLHFITIPTWDVSQGGNDYMIVGDTGVQWGYAVVPEPAAIILFASGLTAVLLWGLNRKRQLVAA